MGVNGEREREREAQNERATGGATGVGGREREIGNSKLLAVEERMRKDVMPYGS